MSTPRIVNAYDAARNLFYAAELHTENGKAYLVKLSDAPADTNEYISPGWIDMHTHIFDGLGLFGARADDFGWRKGVCMVVDAGTVGDYTIDTFRRYVEPTIETQFKLFLNISPIGCIFQGETNIYHKTFDQRRTMATIEKNRDIISGIKVRMAGSIMGPEGFLPIAMAERAARDLDLPLMLHIGEAPPKIAELEPYLKRGDIITHAFSGLCPGMFEDDGRPTAGLQRCLDKGVKLDVGHGGGSFSFKVFEKAHSYGLPHLTLGTDMHRPSLAGAVKSMSNFLSKMYGMKMPLNDMIWGVTKGCSDILGLDGWCDMNGELQNATCFKIVPNDENRPQIDCKREVRYFPELIKTTGVVFKGQYSPLEDIVPAAEYK